MNRRIWTKTLAAVAWLAIASHASAQPNATAGRAPVEVAIGAGRLTVPFYYDDFTPQEVTEGTLDVRVTVPVSERFALEGLVTIGHRTSYYPRTEGLFDIQVKQRFVRGERGRLKPFFTYGATGYYARVEYPERDVPFPGGQVEHLPAEKDWEVDAPFASSVGAGVDYRLSRRLAVRADTQLVTVLFLPLGVRFSAGVSIPLGRYSTN